MRDKAVAEIGGILFPYAQEVIVTAPRQARAVSPETLREIGGHAAVKVAATIEDALALVRTVPAPGPAPVTFITGSLFLVAEARAILVGGPPPHAHACEARSRERRGAVRRASPVRSRDREGAVRKSFYIAADERRFTPIRFLF